MPRFLIDDAAFFEHFGLTANLVGKTIVKILEGVHVLELGLGAQLRLATATQAHVTIATQRSLFHRAIGNADREIDLAQLLHEQTRLFGRA